MKPVKIIDITNEVEASLLSEILKEREIPHLLRSYRDLAYDGLWQTPSSWGHLEAPEEFRDEIMQIYLDIKNSSFETTE
jgi:hypothetical protein